MGSDPIVAGRLAMNWIGVWSRAVIGPAARRAVAVWAGAAIVAAVLFGPTGLQPSTVTLMMRHSIGAAIVVGGTWLLLFVPIARVVVHADGARYLRSLPHSTVLLSVVRSATLVGLQLPWIALWVAGEIIQRPIARGAGPGEGATSLNAVATNLHPTSSSATTSNAASAREWFRGPVAVLIVIAASTVIAATLAAWRPRMRTGGSRRWRSATSAFRALYLAALGRRAGDALVRGAGLALLAGLAAGLFVRNNALAGDQAAKMAGIITALALVPAYAGILSPLLEAHRASAWLAASTGVSPPTRAFSLATAITAVHIAAALIAMVGFAVVDGAAGASTCAFIGATLATCALASALGTTAVVLRAVTAKMAATQMVSGSVVVALGITVALATMSTPVGPLAALIATSSWLVTHSERSVDSIVSGLA